ncbi:MAG: magnesium transporter [Tissierellia bacterium]|nr:magnesium transporter [Tissierellia bacterium]
MKEILELFEAKRYKAIREALYGVDVPHMVDMIGELKDQDRVLFFRLIPKDSAAAVFTELSGETQRIIVSAISDPEIHAIMNELYFDDKIDVLEELPANMVSKILKNTTKAERQLINQFLNYPEDSAGSIMTIEYVSLSRDMSVAEALEHIKEIGLTRETIYTCYVISPTKVLEGIVSLRDLVTQEPDVLVEDIMEEDIVFVSTWDDQEEVAHIFRDYGFMAMPVVDGEHRLTGIVTIDDIIDVIEEESTEDFQKMAAMTPSDEPYLETSIWTLAKNRITWLIILMLTAMITGFIITGFNDVLQASVILVSFIPMLMDTGGNAGNQASTMIIRGIALGEVDYKDIAKVLAKEFGVGIIVAFIMAFVNFFRILFMTPASLAVNVTVTFTLFITVVFAKLVGCALPLFAHRVKLDPAIMASPMITTIVDALALTLYFVTAKILLGL